MEVLATQYLMSDKYITVRPTWKEIKPFYVYIEYCLSSLYHSYPFWHQYWVMTLHVTIARHIWMGIQGQIQDLIGGGPGRDRPKTAILGPQFCRILELGPHFWWSGGGPGPGARPLDPPLGIRLKLLKKTQSTSLH